MKKLIFSLCALCASMGLMANNLPEQVVLVGNATEAVWCIENGVFMHTESEGVYSWTGTLSAGEMKFVAAGKYWVPSYGPANNGDSLHWADTTQVYTIVTRATFDDADTKFMVDSGRYQLTLNLNTMQLSVSDGTNEPDTKAYANYVYPVGSSCPWGWAPDHAKPMPQTGVETGIYHDTITLKAGELKFVPQPNYDKSAHFGPDTANTPLDTAGVHPVVFHTAGDYKWNNTLTGVYAVTLNSVDGTLTLVLVDSVAEPEEPEVVYPEEIYPIGTACAWGWTIDNAVAIARLDDSTKVVYTDTLTLQAGELKFLCQRDFSKHFGPKEPGVAMAEAGDYEVALIEDGDNKWNNTLVGDFVVTLNAEAGTLTLVAVEDPESLIEQTETQEACRKVLRNGQVLILRGDKAYNLLGVTL